MEARVARMAEEERAVAARAAARQAAMVAVATAGEHAHLDQAAIGRLLEVP